MQKIEPKVYCIAENSLNKETMESWLKENSWSECLDYINGSDGEKLIELSSRRCYKSYKAGGENSNPNVTKIRKDSNKYHHNILSNHHGSVLEHMSSTWAIEGCSRIFTHEVIRHRAGVGICQESGRYVLIDNLNYWVPPEIEENEEALQIFEETMSFLEKQQHKLAEIYNIQNEKDFNRKKKLTSAFRRIAPIGTATGIVLTFNMRALRWVIENRTQKHAEVEMRKIFGMIAEIAIQKWPMIFQDFKKIDTNDGLFEWIPENSKI